MPNDISERHAVARDLPCLRALRHFVSVEVIPMVSDRRLDSFHPRRVEITFRVHLVVLSRDCEAYHDATSCSRSVRPSERSRSSILIWAKISMPSTATLTTVFGVTSLKVSA